MKECREFHGAGVNWPLVWFALSLFFPSLAIIEKFFGSLGIVAYLASASFLLWIGHKYIFSQFIHRVTDKWVFVLSSLSFLVLLILFFVMYPIANSGIVGGGSDHDEALNIATRELLSGDYPYYPRTPSGNPISPLPGSLLLAIPFVVLGNEAYQNIFWLAVFLFATAACIRSFQKSLLLFLTVLVLSPAVIHAFVIGSDYIANSLFVLTFTLWTIHSCSRTRSGICRQCVPAILLGISLSSRANFVLLLPLIFSALAQIASWKTAIRCVVVIVVSMISVTLPFYVRDPIGFSPLHTYYKLGQFDHLLPLAGIVIPLITGTVSVLLAFRNNREFTQLLKNSTVVLAFPIVCGMLLSCIGSGHLSCKFASFGVFFLFFGAMAWWPEVLESSRPRYEHPAPEESVAPDCCPATLHSGR